MKLSIVTINYQTPSLTLSCIESVYNAYKKEFLENKFQHIIVDNASPDGSGIVIKKAILEKCYKNVVFVQSKENGGFSKGCNRGANIAKGTCLLFLNSDTEVDAHGFTKMIEFMENHREAGILGGVMKNFNKTQQQSASPFYSFPYILLVLLGVERFFGVRNPTSLQKVDWVKGGFLMIRSDLFRQLKGFDERLFMYTEDMELCFRVKKAGFSVYFDPSVAVFHADQGSSNRSFAIVQIYKGLLYFYKKHYPQWQLNVLELILTAKARIFIWIGRLTGNSYLSQTYEKALTMVG